MAWCESGGQFAILPAATLLFLFAPGPLEYRKDSAETHRSTNHVCFHEFGTIAIIAADRKQARTILRYVRGFLALPMLKALVLNDTAESIELTNRVVIEKEAAQQFNADVTLRQKLAAELRETSPTMLQKYFEGLNGLQTCVSRERAIQILDRRIRASASVAGEAVPNLPIIRRFDQDRLIATVGVIKELCS